MLAACHAASGAAGRVLLTLWCVVGAAGAAHAAGVAHVPAPATTSFATSEPLAPAPRVAGALHDAPPLLVDGEAAFVQRGGPPPVLDEASPELAFLAPRVPRAAAPQVASAPPAPPAAAETDARAALDDVDDLETFGDEGRDLLELLDPRGADPSGRG